VFRNLEKKMKAFEERERNFMALERKLEEKDRQRGHGGREACDVSSI
jgi:hypothetical protein